VAGASGSALTISTPSAGDALAGDSPPGLLSVVVPCYDETEVIGLAYRTLKDVLASLEGLEHEIVFVDDGSVDDTLERLNQIMARDPAVRVLSLSRNFGHRAVATPSLAWRSPVCFHKTGPGSAKPGLPAQ